ncbi:MAG: SDR family oxidoreductase [Salinarimonadaceae bacterium]|nr:MAG: SDR family oxidoreductase [Salinarimonadaceae bacterium]
MSKIRWTVVTGASSGIGAELARVFAGIGHNLVLVARRRSKLEALAEELRASHGGAVEIIVADLNKQKGPQAVFDAVAELQIAPHTLVNSAGVGLAGEFVELPLDKQLDMMNLNMNALTKLCHLFLPGMLERGEGGVINLSSLAAFQAGPHMAVYYASKAFVLSLTEALHEEARPFGVTVTALCPGPTESEFPDTAGMGASKLFRGPLISAARVAQVGVEGYRAGHAIVSPGIANRFSAQIARLMPRFITRRLASTVNRG